MFLYPCSAFYCKNFKTSVITISLISYYEKDVSSLYTYFSPLVCTFSRSFEQREYFKIILKRRNVAGKMYIRIICKTDSQPTSTHGLSSIAGCLLPGAFPYEMKHIILFDKLEIIWIAGKVPSRKSYSDRYTFPKYVHISNSISKLSRWERSRVCLKFSFENVRLGNISSIKILNMRLRTTTK